MVKNPPAMQEAWVQSLSWEDPLEKEWQPTSCLENPKDRGAWQTTVHGVARVGHDLVIKPPPSQAVYILIYYWFDIFQAVL